MTFKHRFKLYFAKIRWLANEMKQANDWKQKRSDFKTIKNLYNKICNDYLSSHRINPNSKETLNLEGKIELLKQILNEGWS